MKDIIRENIDSSNIVGRWERREFGTVTYFDFNGNGVFVTNMIPGEIARGKYTFDGDNLNLLHDVGFSIMSTHASINENTLNITLPNSSGMLLTLKKCDLQQNINTSIVSDLSTSDGVLSSIRVVEAIPLIYESADSFSEGFTNVSISLSKHGYIDKDGKEVIQFKYSDAKPFKNGLASVCSGLAQGYKWGVIDKNDKVIIPFEYDEIGQFEEGFASARIGGAWGLIDRNGKRLVWGYSEEVFFRQSEELAIYKRGEKKYDCINRQGKRMVTLKKYDFVGFFSGKLLDVRANSCYGFVNSNGKVVIPLIYDNVHWFSEGLAAVYFNGNHDKKRPTLSGWGWGFIDKANSLIIPLQYDSAYPFNSGLAAVSRHKEDKNGNKGWGYIDNSGREVIPCQYESVCSTFSGDFSLVKLTSGDAGYINKSGSRITSFDYDYGRSHYCFSEGLVNVKLKHGEMGYIDSNGSQVTPFKYDYAKPFSEGFAVVKVKLGTNEAKYGFVKKYNIFLF
ncbi:MAG: WG repeat-containing protein [Defluviitaleaceae bacterium]|nr:WG repeat-containing protein [Defluviitaleaceae bacterium]